MSDISSLSTTDLLIINPYPIIIWIFLFFFCLSIYLAIQEGITRLRRLHQIPCSRCVFFTGDYRLKCPVHPCKALSEEAIDCLDYEPICQSVRANYLQSHCKSKKKADFSPQLYTSKNN